MIRVTFAEREPEDVPANRASTSADGSLVLEWVELGQAQQQAAPFQTVTVVTGVAWIRTYSRATGWLTAEPAPAESAESAVTSEPATEPESAEVDEREPEEAIR